MKKNLPTLPKVILHEHLEGSVTPKMAILLANKHNVALPNDFMYKEGKYNKNDFPEGRYAYDESDFNAFVRTYDTVATLIRTPEDYYLITKDFLSRNAEKGLIYCEFIVSPLHLCADSESLDVLTMDAGRYHSILDAVEKAISEVKEQYGTETRLHGCAVRHLGAESVAGVADFLKNNQRMSVTGFNIAGNEWSGKFSDFDHAHHLMERVMLGKSYHAGEICGPESVSYALEVGANRIGHGIASIDDPEVIDQLINNEITLEISITSNRILVTSLKGEVANHPVKRIYDQGVRISLNTDDAGIFGTDIEKEYQIAQEVFGFDRVELLDISLCAIESAFVDSETRMRLITYVYTCFTKNDWQLLDDKLNQNIAQPLRTRLEQRKANKPY